MAAVNEKSICGFCKEKIDFTVSDENTVTALKCNHVFHNECIQKWFESSSNCIEIGLLKFARMLDDKFVIAYPDRFNVFKMERDEGTMVPVFQDECPIITSATEPQYEIVASPEGTKLRERLDQQSFFLF